MTSKIQQWIIDTATPIAESAARAAVKEIEADLLKSIGDEVGTATQVVLASAIAPLLTGLDGLPGRILGVAESDVNSLLHDVVGTKTDIAGEVKSQVSPLFSGLNLDAHAVAQQIIGFIKSALPFPFNQ